MVFLATFVTQSRALGCGKTVRIKVSNQDDLTALNGNLKKAISANTERIIVTFADKTFYYQDGCIALSNWRKKGVSL